MRLNSPAENYTAQVVRNMVYAVLVYAKMDTIDKSFRNPCTGTLLRADLVLVPTSCLRMVQKSTPDPKIIEVHVRDHAETSETFKKFSASKVVSYSNSDGDNFGLSLVVLKKSSNIKLFPSLPTEKSPPVPSLKSCELGGYGTMNQVSSQTFNVYNLNNITICDHRKYKNITRGWMCVLLMEAVNPCRGDVGAPLICGDTIYAVYNPPYLPHQSCVFHKYVIFTPLLFHPVIKWVKKVEKSLEENYFKWLSSPWWILFISGSVLATIACIYYLIMHFVQKRYPDLYAEEIRDSSRFDHSDISPANSELQRKHYFQRMKPRDPEDARSTH